MEYVISYESNHFSYTVIRVSLERKHQRHRESQVEYPAEETPERSALMKTRITSNKKILVAATAAGMFLLAGCFSDPSSPSGDQGDMTATIEGRVQGDAALGKRSAGSAGIEGATVTVMRIKSDGSLEAAASAEVKTDVQGHFSVKTAANETRELVVVAKKEAKEWKAVVSAKVKQGTVVVCRPLDTESSVEADVLVKVRGESKTMEVSFADIASHIDGDMSLKASGKADVEAYLSAQVQAEAKARASMLLASSGKFTLAQIDQANEARMDAEAKLESDLDAAGDLSAEAKAKIETDFQTAGFKAWADAGIALGEVAKAHEASYKAMVQVSSGATVESETKLTWLHRIALEHATTLEAAVKEDVKASGGQSEIAVTAGSSLKASLVAAKTETEIDSAFATFRASVSSGLKGFVETTLGGKVLLNDSSKARMELKASLETAVTADKVAEAYQKFYVSAEAEIKAKIAGSIGTADSAKVNALTRTALLIGIQGNGGATVILPGFSLSGNVEGGVSGADVQIAKVNADGSLEIIGEIKTQTDAQGGFTIHTDTKLPDSVVVVVTKNDSRLMVLIDSATSKPVQVGTETTVETQIVQQLIKDGKTGITSEEIKSHVDSNVAAEVKGNDSAIAHLIGSLELAAKAQNGFLLDSGFGLSASGLNLIASARAGAQTRLEADLKAAAGAAASVQAAYDAYHRTVVDAYVQAGLDANTYAKSMQVYAQALARFTVGVTAEAKFSLIKSAHAQAAHGLRTAAEAQVKAAGATDATLKTFMQAGAAFQASVDAAVSAEAIASAYAAYDASVTASLKAALILQASAIESLNAKIRAADGARADLMAKVQAAADADAAAKAHVEFSAAVQTQVKAAFGGGLGAPTGAQVDAMAQAMILANMGG